LTLHYGLASSFSESISPLLSSKGEMEVNEKTNTISVKDTQAKVNQIKEVIISLDTFPKQKRTRTFSPQFARAEKLVPLMKDYLSPEGSVKVDSASNSIIIQDSAYQLSLIKDIIPSLDIFRAEEEILSLRFALAKETASLAQDYLSSQGTLKVNQDKNELLIKDTSFYLEKVAKLVKKLDTWANQKKKQEFIIHYLTLEEALSLARECTSSQAALKVDPAASSLIITDGLYQLLKIDKLLQAEDVFIPVRRVFSLKYISATLLSVELEGLLADQGELEVDEKTNSLIIKDVAKNLSVVAQLIKEKDVLKAQMVGPLKFKDEELTQVLSLISAQAGINIISLPGVSGKVNAYFERPVPVLKALEIILKDHSCKMEIMDNLIRVSSTKVVVPPLTLFQESLTLHYGLASSLSESIAPLLSSKGEMEVNEKTNTISVKDTQAKVNQIKEVIISLDTFPKQKRTRTFSLQFAQAEKLAPLMKDYLSAEGSVKVDLASNSIIIQDSAYQLSLIKDIIPSLDIFRAEEEILSLRFALAEETASLAQDYLSSKGTLKVNQDKNELLIKDTSFYLEKVAKLIEKLDTWATQKKKQEFIIHYLTLEEALSLARECTSDQATLKVDPAAASFVITDGLYQLLKIDKLLQAEDVFIPVRRVFSLKYISATLLWVR